MCSVIVRFIMLCPMFYTWGLLSVETLAKCSAFFACFLRVFCVFFACFLRVFCVFFVCFLRVFCVFFACFLRVFCIIFCVFCVVASLQGTVTNITHNLQICFTFTSGNTCRYIMQSLKWQSCKDYLYVSESLLVARQDCTLYRLSVR